MLILCSWTAVHLDIPPQKMQYRWKYKRLYCALLAVVAPEIFLWMAYNELREAREICKELKSWESS